MDHVIHLNLEYYSHEGHSVEPVRAKIFFEPNVIYLKCANPLIKSHGFIVSVWDIVGCLGVCEECDILIEVHTQFSHLSNSCLWIYGVGCPVLSHIPGVVLRFLILSGFSSYLH